MNRCVNCGEAVDDGRSLCTYHVLAHSADWATANRIMCDFFHRGVVLSGPSAPAGEPIDVLVEELEGAP
jgi:hypothetical protein